MLQENNPDIDFPQLREAVLRVVQTRRHELSATLRAAPESVAGAASVSASGWRQRLRRVPVLGAGLAYVRRGCLAAAAPGLSLRARARALPFVGAALGWGHALVMLPRWRRSLTEEVRLLREREALLQREIDALRLAQGELLRDFGRLRTSLAQSTPARAPDDVL